MRTLWMAYLVACSVGCGGGGGGTTVTGGDAGGGNGDASQTSSDGGSGGGGSVSCDGLDGDGAHVCNEAFFPDASQVPTYEAYCRMGNGKVVTACSHAGTGGACRQTNVGPNGEVAGVTTWYYDDTTPQDVMGICENEHETYIAP